MKYTIKIVDKEETDELDFLLHKELFGENWDTDDEYPECVIVEGESESQPINIDTLIGHLYLLKKKGANYVSIDYHTDHISYIIEGLKIEIATEIDEEEKKKKDDELKEKTRKNIERQIELLNKEYKKLI